MVVNSLSEPLRWIAPQATPIIRVDLATSKETYSYYLVGAVTMVGE